MKALVPNELNTNEFNNKTSGRFFSSKNIFRKILEDKSTEFRVDLIEQPKSQKGLHPDFMRYLMDTVKIDKLLLV